MECAELSALRAACTAVEVQTKMLLHISELPVRQDQEDVIADSSCFSSCVKDNAT